MGNRRLREGRWTVKKTTAELVNFREFALGVIIFQIEATLHWDRERPRPQ